jgi:hypothetical protein
MIGHYLSASAFTSASFVAHAGKPPAQGQPAVPAPPCQDAADFNFAPGSSSFGENGALFSMRACISSVEGGCSGPDPFRGSGCGAKLICSRLARLAKTVRFPGPLIVVVHCHNPSLRTRRVYLRLARASPAALQ